MKVALLADIHANADALAAVLADALGAGVERLVVAGDIVGYYHEPARALALLDEWVWVGVRGNHEEIVAAVARGERAIESVPALYRSGAATAVAQLGGDVDRLARLPHPRLEDVGGIRVLVCHGTPWAIDEYVYPDADGERRQAMFDALGHADVLVYGHTHHPVAWRHDGRVVVNPGSVGQPRDRLGGACWALLDTSTGEVEMRRTPYDTTTVLDAAHRHAPNVPYLVDVLTGRR